MHFSVHKSLTFKLALVSALLSACGTQLTAPQGAPQTAQAGQTKIMTLALKAGVTEEALRAAYPGGRVLTYQPGEGYAVLAVNDAGIRLHSLAVSVVAVESNTTIQTDTADALGSNAWAEGQNAWAEGQNAWAEGSTSGVLSSFSENTNLWSKLDLTGGQALVPELGKGVTVAVIDTGLDLSHPAFAGKISSYGGWDYVGGDASPQEEPGTSGSNKAYGHGTGVAGIVLQVAPKATLLPMRVLSPNGSGTLANVIAAVYDSQKWGAKVINLSLGSATDSPALNTAIDSVVRSGVTVVVSGGNAGIQGLTYPAQNTGNILSSLGGGLIGVGSVDLTLKKSSFSSYGAAMTLTAPGEKIMTAYPNKQRVSATGTSFAAPIVSGTVALAYSAGVTSTSRLQGDLQASATPNTDTIYNALLGKGTVNVLRFLHKYR